MSLENKDTTDKNREWYDFGKFPFPEFLKEATEINSDNNRRVEKLEKRERDWKLYCEECIEAWKKKWKLLRHDEFDKSILSKNGIIIDGVKYQLIYREENNEFCWIVNGKTICSVKSKTKMLPDNSDGNRIRRKYLELRKKYIEMLELDKKIEEKKEKFFEEKIKDFGKEKWNEIAKKRIGLISFISCEYGLGFINFSNSFVKLVVKQGMMVVTYGGKTVIIPLEQTENLFNNLKEE